MKGNLLLIGAGQYGMLVKEVAESTGKFENINFLDDNNPISVGKFSDYQKFIQEYPYAFVAIGNGDLRLNMMDKLSAAGFELATLISPQAYVAPSVQIGAGTIVEPMAVVQAGATISKGCLVCSGAVVKHNAVIGDGCYLDCNSVVLAGVSVPIKTKVEANSIYACKNLV